MQPIHKRLAGTLAPPTGGHCSLPPRRHAAGHRQARRRRQGAGLGCGMAVPTACGRGETVQNGWLGNPAAATGLNPDANEIVSPNRASLNKFVPPQSDNGLDGVSPHRCLLVASRRRQHERRRPRAGNEHREWTPCGGASVRMSRS